MYICNSLRSHHTRESCISGPLLDIREPWPAYPPFPATGPLPSGSDSALSFLWMVQVVLGVVYNVSQDYDSAVEAFEKALQARPDDYSLWNKVRSPPISTS